MSELARVLGAFHDATGCESAVWTQPSHPDSVPMLDAGTPGAITPDVFPAGGSADAALHTQRGDALVAQIPGPRRAWLVVGPGREPGVDLHGFMKFLLPMVTQYIQSALEVEHAANELAERYEEINLLYTISEILGRTVDLNEATDVILREVSETVGARKATVLGYDAETNMLYGIAARGLKVADVPRIAIDDACSVSARVFRTQRLALAEDDDEVCVEEMPYRRGPMLCVPIMWTAPVSGGAEPLGVVNLSDRRSGQAFSAGDQKLIAAIATQIGTAIQNARLVRASVDQQRLAHEMELAHDLQMKLLPSDGVVSPQAAVSARVVPAEDVGGDFYNLFRLKDGKSGALIGDVSGHGYQAALIMALAMSAAAIHSQATDDPGEMLHALTSTLRDELEATEMFISAIYTVVDPMNRTLTFANTGHPHAFLLADGKDFERLSATDPPIGMDDRAPATGRRPWMPERDLLVLFTDGMSDATNDAGHRLGEDRILDAIRANRDAPTATILERVFAVIDEHVGRAPRLDDLTIVLLRS